MERPLWVWLSGPGIFVVVLTTIALSSRLYGVDSPVFGAVAPSLAFTVAWTAWWPILKPKTGFWRHSAAGAVSALLVMAITILLSERH